MSDAYIYPAQRWFKSVKEQRVGSWYSPAVTHEITGISQTNNHTMAISLGTVKEATGWNEFTYYLVWST